MKNYRVVVFILMLIVANSLFAFGGWSNPWARLNYLENKLSAARNHLQTLQLDENLKNQLLQIDTLLDQLKAMKAKLKIEGLIDPVLWGGKGVMNQEDVKTGTAESEYLKYKNQEYEKYGKPKELQFYQGRNQYKNVAIVRSEMDQWAANAMATTKFHDQKYKSTLSKEIDRLNRELKAMDGEQGRSVAQHMADQTKIMMLMLSLQKQTADLLASINGVLSIRLRNTVEGQKEQVEMNTVK